YGERFIARRPAWQRRATRAEAMLNRFGTLFVLAFRFLYGLRTISPVFLGAARYPLRRFVPLNVLSAAIWPTSFSVAGAGVGEALPSIPGRAGRVEELVGAMVVVALVLWLVSRRALSKRRGIPSLTSQEGTSSNDVKER